MAGKRVLRMAMLVPLGTLIVLLVYGRLPSALPAIVVAGIADSPGRVDPGPARWLKGQTHAHTWNSGDGATAPEEVLRWYGERGYDFVVLTDHNVITFATGSQVLAIPGVEITQNLEDCLPPPTPPSRCLLHVNALFVRTPPPASTRLASEEKRRLEIYGVALDMATGMDALGVINHPNFHWAADEELLAALVGRGARFLEIANQSFDSNNEGDATHPSVEALWDGLLSRGLRVWGLASDDAHHFYDAEEVQARGEPVFTGARGFVMVYAPKEPQAIRQALLAGDFYATTGLVLERVVVEQGRLVVDAGTEVDVSFIAQGGRLVSAVRGTRAELELSTVAGRYVRAVVRDEAGRTAWTQPVFLR